MEQKRQPVPKEFMEGIIKEGKKLGIRHPELILSTTIKCEDGIDRLPTDERLRPEDLIMAMGNKICEIMAIADMPTQDVSDDYIDELNQQIELLYDCYKTLHF